MTRACVVHVAGCWLTLLLLFTGSVSAQELEVISLDVNGQLKVTRSTNSFISGNGRYVVFQSSQLLPEDTTGGQIYLRDRLTGELELISANPGGMSGNTASELPNRNNATPISDDGRWVLFRSRSSNLVSGVNPGLNDQLFLRDRQNQITTVVSTATGGSPVSNGVVFDFTMSPNGSHLVFNSSADNLDPLDTDTLSNTYVHFLSTGVTQLACFKPGPDPNIKIKSNNCDNIALSCNGAMVFTSIDDELVSPPLGFGSPRQLFVGLLLSPDDHEVVTTDYLGQVSGSAAVGGASFSCDGRRIAFTTDHPMIFADSPGSRDLYVWDWLSHQIWRTYDTSGTPTGGIDPRFSSDGSWLSFTTSASLDALDTNAGMSDIYAVDFRGDNPGPVRYISHANGQPANFGTAFSTVANDGTVAFQSDSTNLTPFPDTNGNQDIFALQTQATFADAFSSGNTGSWSNAVGNGLDVNSSAAHDPGGFGLEVTPGGGCPPPLHELVTGPGITGPFQGCDTLTADNGQVVPPGASFTAGREIRLNNNFSVAGGATLDTVIDNSLTPFAYVEDTSPAGETLYNARFLMNQNTLSMGASDRIELFSGYAANGTREFSLFLESAGLVMEARSGGLYVVSPTPIIIPAAGWFEVLLNWRTGTVDGLMSVSIERATPFVFNTLGNAASRVDTVRLGAISGDITSTSGSFFLDDFLSWR